MRIDTLHRRMSRDVCALHDAVREILPVRMPRQYETRNMNLTPFIARLNALTEPFGVFNEIILDREIQAGMIANTGLWNPEEVLPENGSNADVRVFWHINPKTHRSHMSQTRWDKRRYYFWEIVMHETIHRHQNALRESGESRVYRAQTDKRELREEQNYLGDYDEVEAYAHDAALELRHWYGPLSYGQAIKVTAEDSRSTFLTYVGTYLDTPKHPALVAFKSKMRAWFDYMGKQTDFYNMLALPRL